MSLSMNQWADSLVSPPRCTPPSPPVAKILIPAKCAMTIVPAIVVPPFPLEAHMAAISRRETFVEGVPFVSASRSI